MNNITLNQQIPISKAREKLTSLKARVKKEGVLYLLKNYKPHMALIDLEYLKELERQADMLQMEMARRKLQDEFTALLRKKGYDPQTVDKKTVYKLLMLDD